MLRFISSGAAGSRKSLRPRAFGELKPEGMAEPVLGLGFVQAEDYFAGCRASLTCFSSRDDCRKV